MKYLSKHYRPAEKELLKLAEDFKKMIALEKTAGRTLPPDISDFTDTLQQLIETIETHVGHRIAKEERKQAEEAEDRANAQAECPRCEEKVPVSITGEIKIPKTGFTHYLVTCKVCNKAFTDPAPISDEDSIKWTKNILKTLYQIQPDGRPLWQCASIPQEDVLKTEQSMQAFIDAVKAEKEAFRKQDEAQAVIDEAVAKMRDELLVMRLKLQQWNGGDAKA